MRKLITVFLLIVSLNLFGQSSQSDSLKRIQYNNAWWARTHGDYLQSMSILNNMIILEPNNPKNYFEKANIYYLRKDLDSLSINLNKALEIGFDTISVYEEYYLFYTFQIKNDLKRIEFVNKMIEINPNESKLYMKRRGVRLDLRDYNNFWKDTEIAARLGDSVAKSQLESREKDTKRLKEKGVVK